jgi:hypothetical protein
MAGKKLPIFLKKYFWEVDFGEINPNKHSAFIIERILELGDQKATNWLLENFPKRTIKQVLCQTRKLSEKSANFWRQILKVDKGKIKCLQKSYLQKRKSHWPY